MKKLLFALLFLPILSHADPLGTLTRASNVQLSTQSSSGGSSTLAVSSNSVIVSSPTSNINFMPPFIVSLQGSTSSQITLNSSSVTLSGNLVAGSNITLTPSGGITTVAAIPPGNNTEITYNNGGAFGSSSVLTFQPSGTPPNVTLSATGSRWINNGTGAAGFESCGFGLQASGTYLGLIQGNNFTQATQPVGVQFLYGSGLTYAGGYASSDGHWLFGPSSGTAKVNINGNLLVGNAVQGTRTPPANGILSDGGITQTKNGNLVLEGLSPGVLHTLATSSNVVTALVDLSTETTGLLPNASVDGSSITKQGLLLAGSNITLTPGVGTLTIASNGGGASPSGASGTVQIASGTVLGSDTKFTYSTATASLAVSSAVFNNGSTVTYNSTSGVMTISTNVTVTGIIIATGTSASGMSTMVSGFQLNVASNTTANDGLILYTKVNGVGARLLSADPSTNIVIVGATTSAPSYIAASTSTNTQPIGAYGENKSSAATNATNLPATTAWGDLVSISLSSGAWIISYQACEQANGATLTAGGFIAVSTTTGNNSGGFTYPDSELQLPLAATTDGCATIAGFLYTANVTQTVYGKMEDAYTLGQPTMKGRISAIRPY